MEIPSLFPELVGIFTLLFVLTGLLFGVAQYYEIRQRKIINECKQEAWWDLDFSIEPKDPAMTAIKEKAESLRNEPPVDNEYIIISLWVLLVVNIFLFVVAINSTAINIVWSNSDGILTKYFIIPFVRLSSLVAFILSFCLSVNLRKMKKQLDLVRTETKVIKGVFVALSASLKSRSSKPNSPAEPL